MSFKVLISLPLLLAFLSLGGCALFDEISPRVLPGSQGAQNARAQEKAKTVSLELYTLENPPEWARTESGVSLRAGGFSGLFFLGKTSAGEYQFMTHTDRGLVGEPLKLPAIGDDVRPFIIPQFQPRWVMLETSHQTSSLKIVKEILLTDPKGQPLTGLPLIHTDGDKFSDEKPVDLAGKLLPMDLGGIDPEGLTRDADGNFWMCEEYRPSILKFSPSGKLIKRFVPKNSFTAPQLAALDKKWGAGHLVANLPEEYRYRRPNRGFEGITFQDGKIYATLQSPLDIPSALHKKIARIVILDVKTETVAGEILYPLYRDGVEKMGDLSSLPGLTGLFAIEQNGLMGRQGLHLITHFEVKNKSSSRNPELQEFEALKSSNQLMTLKTVLSLSDVGYDFAEKVEGLAMISNQEFAVINDNDFGVDGKIDLAQQSIPITNDRPSVLAIIHLPEPLANVTTEDK